ncbi:MAG: hypothetical protein H8E98_07640, partial [Bacteroidetes bacterium]|nr:hypothetical protein [Bacteroidota bacterium]
ASKQYDEVAFLVFSPNSNFLAFSAQDNEKFFIVINGKEGDKYDNIGNPIFSPNSEQLAYGAGLKNKYFVVNNGKHEKEFDKVIQGSISYSPGSKHLTYVAEIEEKQYVIVDGEKGKLYNSIIAGVPIPGLFHGEIIKISFDAHNRFHYLAYMDNNLYLVEEEFR